MQYGGSITKVICFSVSKKNRKRRIHGILWELEFSRILGLCQLSIKFCIENCSFAFEEKQYRKLLECEKFQHPQSVGGAKKLPRLESRKLSQLRNSWKVEIGVACQAKHNLREGSLSMLKRYREIHMKKLHRTFKE